MKGTIKNLTLVATMALMMSACSTMTTVVEKQQDVVPNWYMKCKDTGTEGWFWWSKDYYYACGSGVSGFKEAAYDIAIQLAKKALDKDPKYVNYDYRKEQLWGEKLQASTEILLQNEQLKKDVILAKSKIIESS